MADSGVMHKYDIKRLKGEILVNGKTYGTSAAAVNMAAFPSDREIANVSTYVRQAWGKYFPEVTEELYLNSGMNSSRQNKINGW